MFKFDPYYRIHDLCKEVVCEQFISTDYDKNPIYHSGVEIPPSIYKREKLRKKRKKHEKTLN